MYGYENVYYDPEKFDLVTVGELEWAEPDYSFDMTVVWKEGRGRYWIGDDSGCSCPAPFEDIRDINELDGPHTKKDLEKALKYRVEERCGSGDGYYNSKAEMLKQVSDLLSNI